MNLINRYTSRIEKNRTPRIKKIAKLFSVSIDEEDVISGLGVIVITLTIVTFVTGSVSVRIFGSSPDATPVSMGELSSACEVVHMRQMTRIKTKEATRFILSEVFLYQCPKISVVSLLPRL